MDLLRSLPLGLFLEQPITWLHRLDPRIKLAWLLSFLLAPILATPFWRILLVGLLLLLTLSARIPLRVWRQQLGWLTFLCVLIFALTTVLPDGLNASHQPRQPVNGLVVAQQTTPSAESQLWNPLTWTKFLDSSAKQPSTADLPQPTDYRYVLLKFGSLTVTRRSLDLAIRVSTLLFTLLYSTNLFLLTTAPEAVTAAIENWMSPLRRFKVPVTEIALTLTLSLRFIPLVLEEFQNLVRSVSTRAINWKKLGLRRTVQIWLLVAERLLDNLLLRAAQIASAMTVRGFTTPNQHQVPWHQFRLRVLDWLAIAAIILFWGFRIFWSSSL
ncbi:energy-coupling factor transporter transmembrane protein EcfT [Phormidium sp. CLA17]|uniref:energy-coupling factor transporter transmembrane component T family protein n=1 Tax=Leptolyngbya sp. Cla-17 TaxID=2803751 RepID=UPI00149244A6|nr:energy-coupling factor transporter transmembrane protein EcfT [Leptolyngbya sp. Cla-17]MBM0740207.1 energy-coupling factor transporter transmembrane protein EcfT [Leptolyngbya sp. Cla-17]